MSEFRYGDDRTVHRTGEVNLEKDDGGVVVAVWYRCMRIPFTQRTVSDKRSQEMMESYSVTPPPPIKAIVFDTEDVRQTTCSS